MDFHDPKVAFKSMSTPQLARALLVFELCGVQPLVRNADMLLKTARRVFGDSLVAYPIKKTFFAHFCAGESEESIRPTIMWLNKNGVGAILDFAAEADVAPRDPAQDHRSGVQSARVYDYTTEVMCDENCKVFETAIHAVRNVTPSGFAAIKITALGNPALLERWSAGLVEIRNLFAQLDTKNRGLLNWEEFQAACAKYFPLNMSTESLRTTFDRFRHGRDEIDAVEWTTELRPEMMEAVAAKLHIEGPFSRAALTPEEVKLMKAMMVRVRKLATMAEELDVRLMIDAEHTYFQPAIDNIVLDLQREFNRKSPRIFNTFQCYLKYTPRTIQEHIQRSDREGWFFACKLVRGAYMVLERKRAQDHGVESPIWDTLEETHECYNTQMRVVMERAAVKEGRAKANILVATHNQESVEKALALMEANSIGPRDGVFFGQLLGMSDHLTFTLGNAGYMAFKYVPYGPVLLVLPYLIRRAHENATVFGKVGSEKDMLKQELRRRLLNR